MTELLPGYTAKVDALDKATWEEIIDHFDDANIYQTWSYEAVRSGEENLSHFRLEKDGKLVAAAQVRLAKVPFFHKRVAYLRWGPMWHPRGTVGDIEVFQQALRALRTEYVVKRRKLLRLLPLVFEDQDETFGRIFKEEGYGHPLLNVTQRTLLIDVQAPVEELRKGLHEKWRYNLKTAEKNGLRIEEGTDDAIFQAFLDTYKQTHERKKFLETSDVTQYCKIQHGLAQRHRMRIFVAFHEDQPAAGVICSCLGKMGVFLYGGTSTAALNLRASYLLQWRALNWIKEEGAVCYNLGGINKARNPGTHQFKSGLCGKNGTERCSVGSYDAYANPLYGTLFQLADSARVSMRDGRIKLRAYLRKRKQEKGTPKPQPA
ncbi:peptidoglycan bridge formation glycyltransferase FemA/FemB family protein [Geomonas sp. RF6]|uniref:lipid II:glycine glycyltransferase FemX n=1 Tax=Geomonas sp. RF6 TaxID=2897342 RepID=UPI001E5B6965|nr:peptidoglycan bridge formation glycyltransferase FemA/FemB family protein [Geomonas sp. RF6]UFS70293.1 peptidoglycan bridge formation glycyltransferase FemA/FemB family protein [Geomonas sp. RF6]